MKQLEKIEQYKAKRKEQLSNDSPIKHVLFHKKIHPILRKILRIKRFVMGQTITVVDDKSITDNRTVIYAVTHIGKYDYEMISETLRNYFYSFAGDWELMYGTIDDYYMRVSGVIYIDTEDKEDRKNAYRYAVKALKQGIPVMWFPEGIWNLSESLPMLHLYPGLINAAEEAGVEIVPVAVDQRGKDFFINIGRNIDVNNVDGDKVEYLRNTLATLKWEIWEKHELVERKQIPENYYEKFLEERFKEWPQFNINIVKHREFRPRGIVERQEAFAFMENLIPSKANAFLFRK